MASIEQGGVGAITEVNDVLAQPQPTGDVDTHFVYWFHAPYNVDKVLPELDTAEVLILEAPIHWTPREKYFFETWIQDQMEPLREDGRHDAADVEAITGAVMPPLYRGIAERYTGSGKVIHLVDANIEEHPEIVADVDARSDYLHDTNRSLGSVNPSGSDQLITTQREVFQTHANTTLKRDTIISSQIAALRSQHPGQQIAVVYGQGHTQLSYDALHQGYGRRTFVHGKESDISDGPVKLQFNPATEIIRLMQFGKPVSDELVLRSLLDSSLTAYLAQKRGQDALLAETNIEQWDYDTADLQPQTNRIARSASSEEVERYAKLIDDLTWLRDGEARLVSFIGELAQRTDK